jgi:hypothetical protein
LVKSSRFADEGGLVLLLSSGARASEPIAKT